MLCTRAATPIPREDAEPNVVGRTVADTVAVPQDVEPASDLALELLPDCAYAPDDTDQLPPEVLQPLALPSAKSSEKSVAALAALPMVNTSAVTAAVTPATRAIRVPVPRRRAGPCCAACTVGTSLHWECAFLST
ncbi:hypothetical protein GCM10022251_38790 [Phytohabitans flavus]